MKARLAAFVAGMLLALVACGSPVSPTSVATLAPSAATTAATTAAGSAAPAGGLTIFAAASLKAALAKVKTAYEAANAGVSLTISTDSSAALETQIEQGAPADVFLSADLLSPRKLIGAGLTHGSLASFAANLLTVIVPTANPASIQTPQDLANPGVKVIAAGDAVPITGYATMLVANLAKEAGYPADYAAKYTANIVSREDNVAAVVAKIELGEGDAGIVYVTDARTSTKVGTIAVPVTANVPATYAGVVVDTSANVDAAAAFLAWLAGPDGRAILATFGFLPPN